MSLYRKKPIVVEARQTGKESWRKLAEWCGGKIVVDGRRIVAITIKTLEGTMWARKGDWILKGAAGEFYPVKRDIFPLTFEAIQR